MIIKIFLVLSGILLTLLPFFISRTKRVKVWLVIIGVFFLALSSIDIYQTKNAEMNANMTIDSLSIKLDITKAKLEKIDSSISKYGLKISGDSVIKSNNLILENSTINVKSENQKGGQTAGTINNY